MSILYRIVIILLTLAAAYTLFGIGHFKWMYHNVQNPKAEFQVMGDKNSDLILIEFINYTCGYCKELHPKIEELIEIRKDIRYIPRPVSFGQEDDAAQTTAIVIAAGLNGYFNEFHKAVLEYPERIVPETFLEETANLYGLDYADLVTQSQSKKVQKIIQENRSAFEHTGLISVPSFMIQDKFFAITDETLPDLKQLLNMVSSAQ